MVNVEEYSDLHRTALRTLMNYGMLEEKQFYKILELTIAQLFPGDAMLNSNEVGSLIELINSKIGRFDQKIVLFQFDLNDSSYFIFYSTATTSVSKMQHTFNETELDYFKLLLTAIVQDDELFIPPLAALNIETPNKINKTRVEKMLENWIENGYFLRNDNKIYLGPKSVIEFKEMIQNMELPNLRSCVLCEDVAAWGIRCKACKAATYHKNCLQKYLAKTKKCLACKEPWDETQADEMEEN